MIIENIEHLKSDYIVCECYEVSLGDIIEAIENGYDNIDELMRQTYAGYGCERCQSKKDDANRDREIHLNEILDYIKSRSYA